MDLIKFTIQPGGIRLGTSRGLISLTAYSPRIVRIRYTLEPDFSQKESLMVVSEAQTPTEVDVRETDDSLFFSTSELTIQIDRSTLAFKYLDERGQILTREPDRGGKTLIPTNVIKFIPDTENDIQTEVGADGLRVSASTFNGVVDRKAYHTKLEFEWANGEALYGLGDRKSVV
jgi:alpha-D-xyloside xylohydrolase